ncbi:gamma-glutamylcyclotransferase 2-3-like [Chenopodium quinoa]|uniref:gamma-glutamylcyclotransferase 2-3-like n=1 Tax=Chenopodium quinoa TaxID=63459 RepID=UPI000B76DBDD|nr:gamma-glutamylcyclotransferase 2-3-like [Chenopodium quinoa]
MIDATILTESLLWCNGTQYLEVREKQYDQKVYLDFYTESTSSTPAVSNVLVYVASSDKKMNQNYLGPSPLEELAKYV